MFDAHHAERLIVACEYLFPARTEDYKNVFAEIHIAGNWVTVQLLISQVECVRWSFEIAMK